MACCGKTKIVANIRGSVVPSAFSGPKDHQIGSALSARHVELVSHFPHMAAPSQFTRREFAFDRASAFVVPVFHHAWHWFQSEKIL